MDKKGSIEIYRAQDNQTEIKVRFDGETIWLTQLQMAELFDKDVRTINEHIQNIYKTSELEPDPTIRNFRIVRQEGQRKVRRNIDYYSLDMIISVGYRVNSKRGTQFRQWATQRLKDYLVQGYAINEKRLAQKQQEVRQLKTGIQIIGHVIKKHQEHRMEQGEMILAKTIPNSYPEGSGYFQRRHTTFLCVHL